MTRSWNPRRPGRGAFPPKIRRRIIKRDRECQLRISPHCTGQPDEADHVVNWATAMALGWDPADIDAPDNGQAACVNCHAIKTAAERRHGQQRRPKRQRPKPRHPGLLP